MDIGRPRRIIEVIPESLPLPEPMMPLPEWEPSAPVEPSPEPVEPSTP
jgi:hypothetical protein